MKKRVAHSPPPFSKVKFNYIFLRQVEYNKIALLFQLLCLFFINFSFYYYVKKNIIIINN